MCREQEGNLSVRVKFIKDDKTQTRANTEHPYQKEGEVKGTPMAPVVLWPQPWPKTVRKLTHRCRVGAAKGTLRGPPGAEQTSQLLSRV